MNSIWMSAIPTIVVAGGMGTRLHPVFPKPLAQIADRALLNFPVSNCLNSPLVSEVTVLAQAFPNQMLEYVAAAYHQTKKPVGCKVAPMYSGPEHYAGNADAIRQHPELLEGGHEHILVLAADHLYQMRYDEMIRYHVENDNALTAAVQRMPVTEAANQFGVFTLTGDDQIRLDEKPSHPKSIPGTNECFASLGFYVFQVAALQTALAECPEHDFGHNIIPWMISHGFKVGIREENSYWRDLGTIASYWQAHMDLVAPNSPINLRDPNNPIVGRPHSDAPAQFINGAQIRDGSIFGPGCLVAGSIIASVISRAEIGCGSEINQSVILGRSDTGQKERKNIVIGKNVKLTRVIALEGSRIGDGVVLGEDPVNEARHWPEIVIKEGPDDRPLIVIPPKVNIQSNQ